MCKYRLFLPPTLNRQRPVFQKVSFRFSADFYLLKVYGIKDFITFIVYIIAIPLEKSEVYVYILSVSLISYVLIDLPETFVTLQS